MTDGWEASINWVLLFTQRQAAYCKYNWTRMQTVKRTESVNWWTIMTDSIGTASSREVFDVFYRALSNTGSVEAEPLFDCFVLLSAVVQCRRDVAQDGGLVKYAQN